MDSLEWLHCNRCAAINHSWQNDVVSQPFQVGECGHISCLACASKTNPLPQLFDQSKQGSNGHSRSHLQRHQMSLDSSICPVCEQHVKMVQLDQQMPEDVQKAFISIHSVIEDAVQTIRFQSENSLALIRALKQSNQFLTKKAIEYQHKYREIARQLSQATLEIQQMRQLLQKTRPPQSTYTSNPIAHRPATASSSKSPISSRLSLKPDSRSSGLNTIQPLAMNPNTFEAAAAEEKLAQQHKNRQQMTRQYYAAASTPHFQPSRVIQRPSTGVMRVTMPRPTSSRSTIEHTLEDQMNRKNRVLAPSKSMSSFSQLRFMKK